MATSDCARVVHLYGYGLLVGVGMAAKGGQEVAHAAFCRKVAVEEAEALGIVRVARFLQVTQRLGTCPAVDDTPTDEQKHRDRVKGHLSSCRRPTKQPGQHWTQATKVDQPEHKVKGRQVLPGERSR